VIRWEEHRHVPQGVAAILAALRFHERAVDFAALDEAALRFADRAQCTLVFGQRCHAELPEWARRRIAENLAHNRARLARLRAAFAEIATALEHACIRTVVLKGFAHGPDYVPDPALRVQYDFDLYTPDSAASARDALLTLGYEPLEGAEEFPTDHLPTLIRKTGWQWRGDFFDPELPPAVDLHFRLWDERTEGFSAPGLEAFWPRRAPGPLGRFHPVDALGYAALHLLRHLLRGSLRPYHVYELAHFLEARQADEAFWAAWLESHPHELRRLETLAFLLSAEWFACRLPPAVEESAALLPAAVHRWLARSAAAPLEACFRPNKEELGLHLLLLSTRRSKAAVLRRRLLPTRLPGPVDSVHIPESRMTWKLRVRKRARYAAFLLSRAWFHVRALSSAARSIFSSISS